LINYQEETISRSEMSVALNAVTKILHADLASIFDFIKGNNLSELIVIPDQYSDMLPLIPAIMSDEGMRDLLRGGQFQLRYCPVLHQGRPATKIFDAFLGVWDSSDPLPLDREEIESAIKVLGAREHDVLDIDGLRHESDHTVELLSRVERCDCLHLASHGMPIIDFRDPFFAEMGGPHTTGTLSVMTIQGHFWRCPYSLVMLNACHTSVVTSHNDQRHFSTNEIISYPSLLLLNRRSHVISSQWRTFDAAAYVFTHFFYKRLGGERSTAAAYTAAAVDLYDSSKDIVLEILTNISDARLREQKVEMIRQSREEHPFRLPYCYGTYILHSLIMG
jgi:hypothetical protein